jgi:DNA-binding NtrC family response regulator
VPRDRIAVLVVEDEALIRFAIVADLEAEGFEVFEAADATEAIVALALNPSIQALFTDIDMPGDVDGLKLAAFVRNRWPPIKIIITSGHHHFYDHTLSIGERFIPKPYHADHVIASLRELVPLG